MWSRSHSRAGQPAAYFGVDLQSEEPFVVTIQAIPQTSLALAETDLFMLMETDPTCANWN